MVAKPRVAPYAPPTSNTPKVCPVIGTGVQGRWNTTCADAAIRATPRATSTASATRLTARLRGWTSDGTSAVEDTGTLSGTGRNDTVILGNTAPCEIGRGRKVRVSGPTTSATGSTGPAVSYRSLGGRPAVAQQRPAPPHRAAQDREHRHPGGAVRGQGRAAGLRVWVPSGRRRRFAASTELFAAKPTLSRPAAVVRVRWSDEVAEAGEVRVCVSDELFGKARARVAAKIVRDLGGGRAHVLAVARRYDAYLPSQWQERVKAGRTETYDEWLRIVLGSEPHQERSNVWVAHDTPALVRRWTRLVGAEHFTLVVADETDHGQLPRLFEQMLGLPRGSSCRTTIGPTTRWRRTTSSSPAGRTSRSSSTAFLLAASGPSSVTACASSRPPAVRCPDRTGCPYPDGRSNGSRP